jgi:hypothetical protein
MANTTWSTTDKFAGITLSGGNLTAAAPSGSTNGVRSVDRLVTGKYYWEIIATTFAGSFSGFGIARQAVALNTSYAALGLAGVAQAGGAITVDGGTNLASLGTITSGSLVCFAVDLTNQLLWIRLGAAGNWNNSGAANPATGIGGFAISGYGQGIPVYAHFVSTSTTQITANFGDTAFTGAVPSGFTSGFTAGVTSPTNALATQAALEQWVAPNPNAQVTQAALEMWATTSSITVQAIVTQAALEMWARVPPVAPAGRAKVWNGSAWVIKPAKAWSGSAWVAKPVKIWNGSAWV